MVEIVADPEGDILSSIKEFQAKEGLEDKYEKTNSNGLLIDGNEDVVIPENQELRFKLIRHYHKDLLHGHRGIRNTLRTLKDSHLVWKGMKKDIATVVKSCLVCQQNRIKMVPTVTTGYTWTDKPFF
ncbi:hypothetical protein ADUPG1_005733, partial [Aduncisulcus paluster]